ncbi:MAG TPA: hypothetical protein VHG51_00190 [Longimicrobiaceae bacterium]|nr:hypothetical protein [Longimicrobiaceae bacterium]
MDRSDDARSTEDATEARRNAQRAEENRDALAEQNRRTAATTPDDVPMTGPDEPADGGR